MTDALELAVREGMAGKLLLICFFSILGLCLLDLIILKMERTYESDTSTDAKRVRKANTIFRVKHNDLPEQLVRQDEGQRIQSDEKA